MVEEIINSIRAIRKQIADVLPLLDSEITLIIENQEKSPQRIEWILDTLLDYGYMGLGEAQFNRLNSYYETFNKENATEYILLYHEIGDV